LRARTRAAERPTRGTEGPIVRFRTPGYRCGVQLLPQNRSTVGYLALVTLLFGGLAIGVMLFFLQAQGGSSPTVEFAVTAPQAVDCPADSTAPGCYRFDVANTGGGAIPMRCLVSPADTGTAVFLATGTTVYESEGEVAVGDTYALYTEVEPAGGGTVTESPTVECAAVV